MKRAGCRVVSALVASSALVVAVIVTPGVGSAATGGASGVNMSGAPYWQGWDIVRGVALTDPASASTKPGGYVLDAWGGLHPFGGAATLQPGHYTPNRETAHNLALEGNDLAGTVVTASAKTFPFPLGTTETFQTCGDTSQFGVPTHGITLDPTPAGGKYNLNGATLDAWGGIHPLCTTTEPLNTSGAPWWNGWRIAAGMALLPGGTGGFTLDGWGGVHPWGKARLVTPPNAYWGPSPGRRPWDISRGVAIDGTGTTTHQGNGVVVDGWGGLHPFTYETLR